MSNTQQDVALNVVSPALVSPSLTPPTNNTNDDSGNPNFISTNTKNDDDISLQHADNIHSVTLSVNEPSSSPYSFEPNTAINVANSSKDCFNVTDLLSPDTEEYLSVSTDDTLQNSESDADLAVIVEINTQSRANLQPNPKMGNSSAKKQGHSDDDTPDETRTKCCEIPKKKLKDRNSKASRTSRSDDNDFDVEEVYPFDNRTRSDIELAEPVELEPFEIIETDDIKFVAGAGTSDVIKSASEPKFKVIPEEEHFETADEDDGMTLDEKTDVKQPVLIDRGNRILESGTTTAHSTFEFKQPKSKSKLTNKLSNQSECSYENVKLSHSESTASTEPPLATIDDSTSSSKGSKESNSSSRKSSSSSSKGSSRKNSKEAIAKPSRQNKAKRKTETDKVMVKIIRPEGENVYSNIITEITELETESNTQENDNVTKEEKEVLILTQTMFSNIKKTEKDQLACEEDVVAKNKYENINLCAFMTPTGISIGHKEPSNNNKQMQSKTNQIQPPVGAYQNEPNASLLSPQREGIEEKTSVQTLEQPRTSFTGPYSPGPIYETLTGPSEANKRNDTLITDKEKPELSTTKQENDFTVCLSNKAYGDQMLKELKEHTDTTKEVNASATSDDNNKRSREDSVPPPSPSILEILEEEEEEEIDENDDIDIDEETKRQSAEIIEFSENVCKRLSQLLEVTQPDDEDEQDDQDQTDVKQVYTEQFANHVYETISDDFKAKLNKKEKIEFTDDTPFCSLINDQVDTKSDIGVLKPPKRSDSSSTLKRFSGDSSTYRTVDTHISDDDDLPEYFDPRSIPSPKRDSEIVCDVFDAYVDETTVKVPTISADSISAIVQSHSLNYSEQGYDNVALNQGYDNVEINTISNKDLQLPLKTFNASTVDNGTPSNRVHELHDTTPTAELNTQYTALPELAKADDETPVQHETSGRQSVTCTESDLDISEHRDDMSTDSMLADDEDDETMEILFTKTYTEPVEGAEVFLSCTVVNSAYKDGTKKSETWLSDEALEYWEANAGDVMSTAFMKAKKEMKDIQVCLQSLRKQMEHFHGDCDDISLPDIPVDSLSPDYFGLPRKAVTD